MTSPPPLCPAAPPREARPPDEHANLLTHGMGFLLSLAASIQLLDIAKETPYRIALIVYCLSLTSVYGASALSHAFYDLAWRRFFRMVDQACIFLLIAGSFTPVAVAYLRHGYWPMLLTAMWILAAVGVMLVVRLRCLSPRAMAFYVVLGWLPAISIQTLWNLAPFPMLAWFIAGGLCYSAGTLALWNDGRMRYLHALWHAFVIAGSSCHYIAILVLVQDVQMQAGRRTSGSELERMTDTERDGGRVGHVMRLEQFSQPKLGSDGVLDLLLGSPAAASQQFLYLRRGELDQGQPRRGNGQ